MVNSPLPVFVKVTVCFTLVVSTLWLANVSVAGENVTVAAADPVPVRLTVCGLPAMLSLMLTVPVSVPVVKGVNVTPIVQVAPDTREVPQLFVWPKLPVALIDVIPSVTLPVFVRLTF
jgi:hypothetical protein